MKQGLIFDIKEFAINDGPGIRLTVFMKGCPLRCKWCHNPEGISFSPQYNSKTKKTVGKELTVDKLVQKIRTFKDVYDLSGGGVTFSGGEPTWQPDFLCQVACLLPDIHKTLDTCGYCDSETFKKLINLFDLIYFDLKLINNEEHKKYTEVSNEQILENLKILSETQIPYHIRIPLIPTVTDTQDNLNAIRDIILSLHNKPQRVDPLPYNICAGGKYPNYFMEYPLKELEKSSNNISNIEKFKNELRKNNINTIGDEIQCLQKA